MTGAKKVLILLIAFVVVAGAAFGGGVYFEMQKRRIVEKQLEESKKKAAKADADTTKLLAASRGRTQVLEAVLGVIYQNYGMAFDRIVRTKSLAAHLGILETVDKDIDELMGMLTQQKPEAVTKLLALADKLEPTPALTLPKAPSVQAPPAAAANPGAPVKPGVAAPVAPAANPVVPNPPKLGGTPDEPPSREFQEGREALRQAKELLLSGGESHEMIKKLARAQVLLDESGYTELDDDLGAAIKAAKSKDEARVRTALEAALARIRTR